MVRCNRRTTCRRRTVRDCRRKKQRFVDTALNIVTILVSVVLIGVILLQTKGSSFSGAFGGGSDSIQRTRRGFEKTLFEFTIGISVFFVALCVLSSIFLSR
jgi:preprotein translocase subunit SecG